MKRYFVIASLCLFFCCALSSARAQEAVVATVNDHPVTSFDIDQRIKLLGLLGINDPKRIARKAVANSLIDDYVKIDEAKLGHIDPNDKDIEERLATVSGALKTDRAGLPSKLAGVGVTEAALRQYLAAQMSFARLLQVKYHTKVEVNQADIDKKFSEIKSDIQGKAAKIESDPRRQPVLVLQLQEINFPVEGADPQLLQSRAVEAGQVVQKMTSCAGIKEAIGGIFNVQIGKKIEADAKRIPAPLMAQLKQRGVGRPVGPIRYAKGIQLLALCGSRTIKPPPLNVQLPTRQQIEGVALNDRFEEVEKKYVALMRKTAVIEYKDQSYAQ